VFAPRWSPDGRSLAVISADNVHRLLLDLQTHELHPLVSGLGLIGFFDAQAIQTCPGAWTEASRIGAKALAPNQTPLFVRDLSTQEIRTRLGAPLTNIGGVSAGCRQGKRCRRELQNWQTLRVERQILFYFPNGP